MCNSNAYVLIDRDKMSEIFARLPEHVLNKRLLKLNKSELVEGEETSSSLVEIRSSLSNSMGYPFVGLNNGVTIHNGIDVMLNHTGVCLNLKTIAVGVLDHVDVFYCCSQCGKVYWEGVHLKRFVKNFHEVFDATSTI